MADEAAEVGAAVGPAIDPTKNVLDLVNAESKFQNAMREATVKRSDDLSAAESRRQDELRDAEIAKSKDIRSQREFYETRLAAQIADSSKHVAAILAAQTSKDALLLSQAVDKFGDRLAAIEKNQAASGGQSSVRDPAMADSLSQMALAIRGLTGSKGEGQAMLLMWIFAAIAAAGTIFNMVSGLR